MYRIPNRVEGVKRRREWFFIFTGLLLYLVLSIFQAKIFSLFEVYSSRIFSLSSVVAVFLLSNFTLLLVVIITTLFIRNLSKVIVDKSDFLLGKTLRKKLILYFLGFCLIPSIIIFALSLYVINSSMDFWWSMAPITDALNNSQKVGGLIYEQIESNNRFFHDRISYQITSKNLLNVDKKERLNNYIKVVQREFNIYAVEVYSKDLSLITSASEGGAPIPVISDTRLMFENMFVDDPKYSTFSDRLDDGELIRTIAPIYIKSEPNRTLGYLVINQMANVGLSQQLDIIEKGFMVYKEKELLGGHTKEYYFIILAGTLMIILSSAMWFGGIVAKSITIPISQLVIGTQRVASGELDFVLKNHAQGEVGFLVSAFNKMTADLKSGQIELARSTEALRKENILSTERMLYIESVLKQISTGVITIDLDGVVRTVNKSVESILDIKAEDIVGKMFKNFLFSGSKDLFQISIDRLTKNPKDDVNQIVRPIINDEQKSLNISTTALLDYKDELQGFVVVIDDITSVERVQQITTWREVAQRVNHEVKNPLTPIGLSAQLLQRRFSKKVNDKLFDECLETIIHQVDRIKVLLKTFSSYAKFPEIKFTYASIVNIIQTIVSMYDKTISHVDFLIASKGPIPDIPLDSEQIQRCFINIIDNSLDAMNRNGKISFFIRVDEENSKLVVEFSDTGPGISESERPFIFKSQIKTKKAGGEHSGLGLIIVKNIIENHKGDIEIQDNKPSGVKFVIRLPLKMQSIE